VTDVKKYLGISLDPVHIGAGGYRLGRVDNTIVRDPATDIPKIPGTSLTGVIREYSTIYLKETERSDEKSVDEEIDNLFGNPDRQGALRFYDAQIVLFPVSSIKGTIWITTKNLLSDWLSGNKELIKKLGDLTDGEVLLLKGINAEKINLGWLLFDVVNRKKGINFDNEINLHYELKDKIKRVAVVSDSVFSQLINNNLEVRTSVRIDNQTGTAEQGGLFTYEAIPRGTVFGFEMIIDKRRQDEIDNWDEVLDGALNYTKLLGIGGMGTRGFGRVSFFKVEEGKKDNGES
jgi:CRISPR-associated protein Cmr4